MRDKTSVANIDAWQDAVKGHVNATNEDKYASEREVEVIDVIDAAGFLPGFAGGNMIKYILRHQKTNNEVDLLKASHYAAIYYNHFVRDPKTPEIKRLKKKIESLSVAAIASGDVVVMQDIGVWALNMAKGLDIAHAEAMKTAKADTEYPEAL